MEVPASGRSIILKERLQKIISHAGICSRRKAEELIKGGKVTVNGVRVTELGSEADVRKDNSKFSTKVFPISTRNALSETPSLFSAQ